MRSLTLKLLRTIATLAVVFGFVGLTGCDNRPSTRTAYEEFYDDVGELDYARREEQWKLRQLQKKAQEKAERVEKVEQGMRPRYDEIGEMSIEPIIRKKAARIQAQAAQSIQVTIQQPRREINVPAPEAAPEYANKRG